MTSFLLLRHAESIWNEAGRFQGWADPPLSDSGRDAARLWASGLDVSFAAVVSSDLARSRSTAELMAQAAELGEVDVRRRLREQDQGAWTGLTKAEVKRTWPDLARRRPREPHGGETQAELTRRVWAELEELASQYSGLQVLVVTHAGVIKAVERALGCDDTPVRHLQGRWIHRATGGPTAVANEPEVGTTKGPWSAGTAMPERRAPEPVILDSTRRPQ